MTGAHVTEPRQEPMSRNHDTDPEPMTWQAVVQRVNALQNRLLFDRKPGIPEGARVLLHPLDFDDVATDIEGHALAGPLMRADGDLNLPYTSGLVGVRDYGVDQGQVLVRWEAQA